METKKYQRARFFQGEVFFINIQHHPTRNPTTNHQPRPGGNSQRSMGHPGGPLWMVKALAWLGRGEDHCFSPWKNGGFHPNMVDFTRKFMGSSHGGLHQEIHGIFMGFGAEFMGSCNEVQFHYGLMYWEYTVSVRFYTGTL